MVSQSVKPDYPTMTDYNIRSFSLRDEHIEWLDEQENRSEVMRSLIDRERRIER